MYPSASWSNWLLVFSLVNVDSKGNMEKLEEKFNICCLVKTNHLIATVALCLSKEIMHFISMKIAWKLSLFEHINTFVVNSFPSTLSE